MKNLLLCIVMLLVITSLGHAAVTAQITKSDASGNWTAWKPQPVTEIGHVAAPPGPHVETDDDSTQDWYIPNWVGGVIQDYIHVQFELPDFTGQYAFRVSFTDGAYWSPMATVEIEPAEENTVLIHAD